MTSEPILLTGTAHPALASAVARQLGVRLTPCVVERFPDGEIRIELQESVRRREVFILQPTSPPAGDHLLELLALADACRRAAADRLVAVIPYFGYARSDRRGGKRQPVMAAAVARMLESAGVTHVVTLELHAPQIEGFFTIPLDHLSAVPRIVESIEAMLPPGVVVVAPDAGALRLAVEYAGALGAPVVAVHKRRASPADTAALHLVGEVKGRPCLIVDDMISTGGTIVSTVRALLACGAAPDISVAATHAVFVSGAREKLELIDAITRVIVTDSIPHEEGAWTKLRLVSIAPLLAGAITRIAAPGSLFVAPPEKEPCLATSLS